MGKLWTKTLNVLFCPEPFTCFVTKERERLRNMNEHNGRFSLGFSPFVHEFCSFAMWDFTKGQVNLRC